MSQVESENEVPVPTTEVAETTETTDTVMKDQDAVNESPGQANGGASIQVTEQQPGSSARMDTTRISTVSEAEWDAMIDVLNAVYAYRIDDEHDPSKVFHRKVNKRVLPDYYTVITEPMALSTIKAKLNTKEYKSFAEFVRDFALIPHNAQVYNRPDAGAYQDALVIKDVIQDEFQKLAEKGVIPADVAKLPFLGEIPPPDEEGPGDEEEEEDDEDDEEEEEDTDDEGKKKRRRGGRASKRDKDDAKDAADPDARKKRGRPPRVDTPLEARIKEIIKGMRKFKNSTNQMKISHFERLPDKSQMPEYFNEIKQPMAMDVVKKKLKRKKYSSVDQFMKDVELMFENAKMYNQDESIIYKDAVDLQGETRALAEQAKKRPDTDFVMEDGRLPMPNGILHGGELWKVGDWVHIQNANDVTKPIVAQIYRTWQDADGDKWVNACWYYRPEQTVHRFDKHFFENEVVKTGQYRDHRIDEVVDRCFVMFFTRYNKGRPRNFPPDKEIYVCEARYNEEKHKMNKIKTWASCLPDEVRDKDYEMDLFEQPKRMKKIPSPIVYMLKDDAKETDDLPKPTWGAENAPPKIGAVHKRPRDPKDSPPPEPTPSPPPPAPPQTVQRPTTATHPTPAGYRDQSDFMNAAGHPGSAIGTSPSQRPPAHAYSASQYGQHPPVSPAPPRTNTPAHGAAFQPSPITPGPHPVAYTGPTPIAQAAHHPHPAPQNFPTSHTVTPATHGHPQVYPAPQGVGSRPTYPVQPPSGQGHLGYKAPTIDVYHLDDRANSSVPPEIRKQFHTDRQGRILFYAAPPAQTEPTDGVKGIHGGKILGHGARYLAAKAEREKKLLAKRKLEGSNGQGSPPNKKNRTGSNEADGDRWSKDVQDLMNQALGLWGQQILDGMISDMKHRYGESRWQGGLQEELSRVAGLQEKRMELVEGRETA
ncbi:Bromodomain-containing protein [Eremomyces bilateralis CBS 781.70]|uniref:Bromodomain-containing protein n=1 Tax=Eremomyces bilateralis CBS 781.70 TaxID=1392243 RepID=A0A6G1FRZ7_9PEZI|nr:Bromodomain-containing protein [Eremomyces bilateralis CBS 781.70]KAF1808490.1 Bromodomain-containing protein [Eremomyces bilateralis CBS 781.70]